MKKSIALLGSTGSVGQSTLQVVRHLSSEISVKGLAAYSDIDLLQKQIDEFQPEKVAVFVEEKARELKKRVPHVKVLSGPLGIEEVAASSGHDFVVVAMSGMQALIPTLSAIENGKGIGLANKEILVSAGDLLVKKAKEKNVPFLPIDSEHSALFQCLENHDISTVHRLILTASGGPFRSFSLEQLSSISVEDALAHPTWRMGPKITIDSSTLMNKGLEVIEAHFLFGIPENQIEVIIHPQSIIHSMVEYIDGSILAEMSEPSMIYPIQYALTYPTRKPSSLPHFDFTKHNKLEFYSPDLKKFRSLHLAYQALKTGGSLLGFLNAANEVLVERFLKKEISWLGIMEKLEKLMSLHQVIPSDSVEAVLSVDEEAREKAMQI